MKKSILFALSIVLLTTTFLLTSCFKPDDEGWTDDEKASYEEVISLQDEVSNNLNEWFLSMDSLDAINKAQQYFADAPSVSESFVNSQGIAVQYANGMRGGIYLNPLDGENYKSPESLLNDLQASNSNNLKSIVNKRKMILINPHYYERSNYTDQIYSISRSNVQRAGIDLSTFYKNNEATVDRFTELSGYGIIQIYSHGWAWPKKENITDVYLLTGETANETTTKKYWDEIKTGNIPVMKIAGRNNSYLISERFIEKYNDFSKDTVLFYGGFCYSFLGAWPDLVESFADGAYLGFDWSVYTFRNANWSVNLMALMSDTSKSKPMNLEAWMNDPNMAKSYLNSEESLTVHIYYTGDGNLTLWDDTKVQLIPLSDDGTPVSKAGEAGVAYPFKCVVTTTISELEYLWDIGDGSAPVTASNAVNITWSEDGNYQLKVEVKDKSNGNIIGTAKLPVTIGESGSSEVKDFILTCNSAGCGFDVNGGVQFSPPDNAGEYISWASAIEWGGLSFSGTEATVNGGKITIDGSISEDGTTVSYVADLEYVSEFTGNIFEKYTITVSKLPFTNYSPDGYPDPFVEFFVYGVDVQNYVTSFEGYEVDAEGNTNTVTGVDWSVVKKLTFGFVKK